ncbi:formyltransferase family protein [Sediminibacterium sp. KACHI17]|uniref:Formyltransferase family protein n=1 Tax=Sediminibacterium sp. KACHI17 TaxID=1751071 RepID=A0AAT9GI97_9BACT
MRIVFIGCVDFSRAALMQLIQNRETVVGVITKSDSTFNADFCNLSNIAEEAGIPYKLVNDINHPNNVLWIRQLLPDIIFCFGWSNLLKKEILNSAPLGVVGYHPAMLPLNKGRHPLIWTKVLGLPEGGSTFFFMDEDADSGDILHQQSFVINFEDDASDIYKKMTSTALEQINIFIQLLKNGTYLRLSQDRTVGNHWRKRSFADGAIDFRMSTETICNLVRALTKPYVGAHCNVNGNHVKIWKVAPGNCYDLNLEPGKILSVVNGVIEVKTANSSICLVEHEFPVLPHPNKYLI